MEVQDELMKMVQENKGFSLLMPNGDELSFSKWGKEKNYSICIKKCNTNVYEKVGMIKHQSIDYFRETMFKWFS